MTADDTDRRCNRCGGEAVPADGDGVAVLECADCGNVLGLARPDETADDVEGDESAASSPEGGPVSTEAVHATDGNLDQLVRLLGTRSEDERIEADRLVLETETATMEVTADGDALDIRSVGEE